MSQQHSLTERVDKLYEFERAPVTEDRLQSGKHFAALFGGEHVAGTELISGEDESRDRAKTDERQEKCHDSPTTAYNFDSWCRHRQRLSRDRKLVDHQRIRKHDLGRFLNRLERKDGTPVSVVRLNSQGISFP